MGSLRTLLNDRREKKAFTDAFGQRITNFPDPTPNTWYWFDLDGRPHVPKRVESIVFELISTFPRFDARQLHQEVMKKWPEDVSEIVVTAGNKTAYYYTFNPEPNLWAAGDKAFIVEDILWSEAELLWSRRRHCN